MDDIRRPQHQRRDFALRHRPHQPRPGSTAPIQEPPQPSLTPAQLPFQASTTPANPNTEPQPYYQPPAANDAGFAPLAAREDDYEHYSRPITQPQPGVKKRMLPRLPLKYWIGGAAALILIAAGGYLLTRPAQKSGFSVAQLSKKSTFGFYYPQPLPDGYSFETKINAFQDGQAYFMLANGSKHIIFHEQAVAGQSTAAGLSGAQAIQTPAGKATLGTVAGQPAAKVLAGSTLISINTTGSVPASDVSQAINSLKTAR